MILDSISHFVIRTSPVLAALGVLFPSGLSVLAATGCMPAPAGLVGWWRAENNAADSAGNNSGELVGNTTFGSGVGQCFEFDGDRDAVVIGNPTNLRIQNLTIETWIKRNNPWRISFGADGGGFLFGYVNGGYVFYLGGNAHLYFGKAGTIALPSKGTITDTNYHHVAVTKSGSTVTFYIDGVSNSVVCLGETFDFSAPVGIGGEGDDADSSFLGRIDELAVYNRALTPAEILGIYNAADLGKCARPAAVAPVAGLADRRQAEGKSPVVTGGATDTFDARRSYLPNDPLRIWFTSIKRHPHGPTELQFAVAPDRGYRIEASTNLVDWEAIGVATQGASGAFEFEDVTAAEFSSRFYRVVTP